MSLEFRGQNVKIGDKVHSGNILIDGLGVGDIGNIVLRDRRLLSQDGILIVVITLDKKEKTSSFRTRNYHERFCLCQRI